MDLMYKLQGNKRAWQSVSEDMDKRMVQSVCSYSKLQRF